MGRLPLVLLTACHKLFDLEHVTSGAAGDGSMTDTATCITDTGDEDGDGIVDACDVCPTVENTGGDDDGDGLLDVCDPNLTR